MVHPLDALLRPRSVAVIGASRKRGTIAAELFHNLVHFGFAGAVYPVNPTSSVVQSVRAYRSVLDIPDEVDLAVLVVPAAQVLAAVEECGRKGVRGLVLISAGFAEIGGAGAALQDKLVARLRHWGMRMVGPNCLGLLNADPAVSLDATFAPTFPPFGPVSFASQSGALGLAILDHAVALGIGISQFVSIGNKADVSAHDLIEYWEDDPATQVILLYLESLGDTRRFMRLARRVARKKPIVVVKSGRTAAGARAASSHTGSLAGADVAVDALLGQAGVIRTDTIEELFEVAMVLANQPVPRGRRVAVLTNAGGPGIMATDACESRRLEVARLAPETEHALRAFLPAEASVKNPVDMIASATPESYEKALRILLADAGVDAVLVIFVTPIVTDPTEVAHAVRAASDGTEKTVVTCIMGTHGVPAAQAALRAAHVPSFAFPEAAARALAKAADYGAWLAQPAQSDAELLDITPSRAREALGVVDAPRWLEPDAVRTVLEAYGLHTPRTALCATADEAAEAASRVGFPLVVKLASPSITHKTDVGGVILGVRDVEGVRAAYATIEARLTALGRRAEMSGVLIQAQVEGGVELFVGSTLDPAFGPLIGFGIGGVNVELWRDIVFRVAPLTEADAYAMLSQIRATALLDGFRGGPVVDRAAIAAILVRVSRLVGDLPELRELDINPLVVGPRGVIVVDARIAVAPVA